MSSKIKLLFVALVALCALTVSVGTASASRGLTLRPGGAITATSNGKLTLQGGGLNVECDVSLSGSLATSITKGIGNSVGSLSSGSATACNLGVTVVILFPSAWALTYNGFTGTLPSITGVRFIVRNAQFLLTIPGVGACLFAGDVPAILNSSGGSASSITVDTNSVPLRTTLSGICPAAGRLVGGFRIATQTLALV